MSWFKKRKFGYGWTPCSWQGWLVSCIYLLAVFTAITNSKSNSASDFLLTFIPEFVLYTLILAIISYWTTGTTDKK